MSYPQDRMLFCFFMMLALASLSEITSFGQESARQLPTSESLVNYQEQIAPIFSAYCVGCHNEDDAEGGLNMQTHAALLTGGESGASIEAGSSSESPLWLMAAGRLEPVMPPDQMDGPTEQELALIARWIDQGAIGPAKEIASGHDEMPREPSFPKIASQVTANRPITAITLSPDGKTQAIARFGQIELVSLQQSNAAKLKPVVIELEQQGKVNSLQFSRDGSRLLVGSGVTGVYGAASVFDLPSAPTSGKPVHTLVGHKDVLYCAVWSPDESLVATAGYDRDIMLWDTSSGEVKQTLKGHNGAIHDLAFSPDGTLLISGSADETAKVWNVSTGQRLDTLSQSEDAVHAVGFSPDGQLMLTAGGDNRLRVYRLVSRERPAINPLIATRQVDQASLLTFTDVADHLLVMSQAGSLKLLSPQVYLPVAELPSVGQGASDLWVTPDGKTVMVSMMDGRLVRREFPRLDQLNSQHESEEIQLVYLDLPEPDVLHESDLRQKSQAEIIAVPRSVMIRGTIDAAGAADRYSWSCRQGEVWAIDADAGKGSKLDPMVAVIDSDGNPVLRVRLQAVRDSYFTFRGKNSNQSNDFRLFAWREMNLNDYLFASGEVTRLWIYPRGPDSGFNVYPGRGDRHTYFDTNHTTHALGEPAFVVRPLQRDQKPLANGLPVFEVTYQNDDDPQRLAGKNSRLLFTAPEDGQFTVRIQDTRGEGGPNYDYELRVRAAQPDFAVTASALKPLPVGGGREVELTVNRIDGFTGPVTVDIDALPLGVQSTFPCVVQQGQRFAQATLWRTNDDPIEATRLTLIASAQINGRFVQRKVAGTLEIKAGDRPEAIPRIVIHPDQRPSQDAAQSLSNVLSVHRGDTVSAKIVLDRKPGFDNEVQFGKEYAARGAPHGIYVDNIGLNGLLVRTKEQEREFFLTVDRVTPTGQFPFFLKTNTSGGVTTVPIIIEVLP